MDVQLGVIPQERLKIEVKLLFGANRKSYNYYAASIGTTTDDIECTLNGPFTVPHRALCLR